MFKKIIILLLIPIIVFGSEDKYVIDKTHFSVGFLVEHVGYAKTLGMFREIDGSYTHDLENNKINDIKIVINTNSVFTNHDKRDKHLISPDFLDVEKHPEMIFVANNININKNETLINGSLTLLGVTKPLTLKGKINKIGKYPFGGLIKPYVMGISARGIIKRSDYGMMYALKDNLVGDDIELIIEFEARRQ
ncbi:MAG: YceI family protein [Gammaproteobacteria bacterium]|nr:YceI family protein [Gammaproteobacteria bacterium]MBL6819552.1 YceI family protein [Gammaproteobacteria bacterium]MBL6899091.1 YceI family protein [Gammaproteobacteria bacterium]